MLSSAIFLLFVVIAVCVQNITGFALALVLLGLVGASNLLPLPDAVNVVTVISLVNAAVFLSHRRALRLQRTLWPALGASLLGTGLGVLLLGWIAGAAYEWLRLLLGLLVIGCAVLLWREAKPLAKPSPPGSFLAVGLVSGLMGGLFSTAGPPLVYQLYRQPWGGDRIKETLVFFFGVGSLVRLLVVLPTGGFSWYAAGLTAMSVPVVVLVTRLTARGPVPLSPALLKALVCLLLVGSGLTMVVAALRGF